MLHSLMDVAKKRERGINIDYRVIYGDKGIKKNKKVKDKKKGGRRVTP